MKKIFMLQNNIKTSCFVIGQHDKNLNIGKILLRLNLLQFASRLKTNQMKKVGKLLLVPAVC